MFQVILLGSAVGGRIRHCRDKVFARSCPASSELSVEKRGNRLFHELQQGHSHAQIEASLESV